MTTASTDLSVLLSAVTALQRAVRFDEALALLDATEVGDDADRLALLMARAEVVGQRDYTRGVRSAGDHPLEAAQELATRIGTGPTTAWDLAMLQLRRQYADQLVGGIGPAGRDQWVVGRMAAEATRLRDTAPDQRRRGWALMCLGWIADNLRGDRAEAPPTTTRRSPAVGSIGDPLLVFEAQRHLGDHAHDDGDHAAPSTRGRSRPRPPPAGTRARRARAAGAAGRPGPRRRRRGRCHGAGGRGPALGGGRGGDPARGPGGRRTRRRRPDPAARGGGHRRVPETRVPYGGTAGQRDDARSGERLPWLHAPAPSRMHASAD